MTVSLTVVREETKERKRRKEKRNLKQKKAFNDTLSFQINIITVYLAFVLGLYLVEVKKKKTEPRPVILISPTKNPNPLKTESYLVAVYVWLRRART